MNLQHQFLTAWAIQWPVWSQTDKQTIIHLAFFNISTQCSTIYGIFLDITILDITIIYKTMLDKTIIDKTILDTILENIFKNFKTDIKTFNNESHT